MAVFYSNFLIPFLLFILPVEDCSPGNRKLIVFNHFSQRLFLDFNYVSSWLGPFIIFRKCDVLNRGLSGYTSAFNKLILPKVLQCDNSPKGSIAAAVVLLGSNDSILADIDPRGLTVEEYVTNLSDILTQFMNDGIAANQLILLTPPAVSEVMFEKHCHEMGKQP